MVLKIGKGLVTNFYRLNRRFSWLNYWFLLDQLRVHFSVELASSIQFLKPQSQQLCQFLIFLLKTALSKFALNIPKGGGSQHDAEEHLHFELLKKQ